MFPTLSQYNSTIQKEGANAFKTLTNLSFIPARTSPIKIYSFGSGSFALVFKALENNKEVAIRCFIGTDSNYVERYRKIDKYLANIQANWKSNICFLENEIKVDGKYFPVLKMDWVNGKLLNNYIDLNLHDNNKLHELQKQLVEVSRSLEANKIGHSDIQESNILISEIYGKPNVKLIDYDGIYIPDFFGEKQIERGRAEYQHPNRSNYEFNEKIDRFSFWVILCALEALKYDKSLWKEIMKGGFNTLSNMLFSAKDFSNPYNSRLFHKLYNLNEPSLNFYLEKIQKSLNLFTIEKVVLFNNGNISLNEKSTTKAKTSQNDNIKYTKNDEFDRIKITSIPDGATVRDNTYKVIGQTPLFVSKKKYANTELKVIFGTQVKSKFVYDYIPQVHVTFESTLPNVEFDYKQPDNFTKKNVVNTPVNNKKDESFSTIFIILIVLFICVLFVVVSAKKTESNDFVESNIETVESYATEATGETIEAAAVGPPNESYTYFDCESAAKEKFDAYLPKILSSHNAILNTQKSYIGDFTGDGIDDVAIYFALSTDEVDNTIVWQGITLYQNLGNEVEVMAGFEPDYWFEFVEILNGSIYINKLQFGQNDVDGYPIKTRYALTISGKNVY